MMVYYINRYRLVPYSANIREDSLQQVTTNTARHYAERKTDFEAHSCACDVSVNFFSSEVRELRTRR